MDKRRKILIVDDSEMNRLLLSDILEDQYEILEAENGMEASAILQNRESEISLILLDIVMPVMDGFEMLAVMNKNGWIQSIPVIMISAETVPTYVDRAFDLGVQDYITRPFDERTVRRRVASTITLYAKQKELSDIAASQFYQREKDNRLMIEILSNLVEFRNGESGLHVLHIHTLTELLLKKLLEKTDKYGISQQDIPLICNASALHDIGKISVPSEILNKPGRLTKEEFEIMKTHSEEGARILYDIPMRKNEPLIQTGYQICRWHHERYDGRGYPDGLKGEEIPIAAQVVAMADVYDALTSWRVYKDAYPHEKAVQMILNGECGAFNPLLLECLQELSGTLENGMDSSAGDSETEILDTVSHMLETGNMETSKRTVRLLEHECIKNQFFARVSREIQFEYTEVPRMMILSRWGAEQLGVPETIPNPGEEWPGEQVFSGGDYEDLMERLKNTTPGEPEIEAIYLLNVKGQKRRCKVIAHTIWSADNRPKFEGAIGKIDVH